MRMPEQQQNTNQDAAFETGRMLVEWVFPEYTKHNRGTLWYVIAGIIAIGFLIYAIQDGNFLFGLMILLFAFIIFTHHRGEPLEIPFAIFERGIQVGKKFYFYRELESFAVVYEPPLIEQLYLMPKTKVLRSEISIPLQGQDPLQVRSLLLDFMVENLEMETESNSDAVSRFFKL